MGSSQSVHNKSVQDIRNSVTQISEQHCINISRNSQQIDIHFVNSKVGKITITTVVFINGASCNLRASLSSEIFNELVSKQKAEAEDIDGVFSGTLPWQALANVLSGLGSSQEVTNENYQQVMNQITQILNSSCQNKVLNEDAPINISFEGSTVKGIDIGIEVGSSNTDCTIENMIKSLAKNDVKNDQEATAKKETGSLGGLFAIIAIIIVVFIVFIVMAGGIFKKLAGHGSSN